MLEITLSSPLSLVIMYAHAVVPIHLLPSRLSASSVTIITMGKLADGCGGENPHPVSRGTNKAPVDAVYNGWSSWLACTLLGLPRFPDINI
jgi:hypothetical protein